MKYLAKKIWSVFGINSPKRCLVDKPLALAPNPIPKPSPIINPSPIPSPNLISNPSP